MLKEEYAYIVAIVVFVFLLAYSLYSKEFFYTLTQFLVMLNVPASSYAKIVAFFGIAILIFVSLLIIERLKIRGSLRNYLIVLPVVIFLIFAINLANSLVFYKYANLAYNNYFNELYSYENFLKRLSVQWVSFAGDSTHYYTVDGATHSHQSKSAVFFFLKMFGLNKALAADIGEGAYAAQSADEVLIMVLLSIAAAVSLIYLTKNYLGLLASKKRNVILKIILAFAYAIALFQAAHSLYDGGLLVSFWVDSITALLLASLLLKHYADGDNRYLYLFVILILLSPQIYSTLSNTTKNDFGMNMVVTNTSDSMIKKIFLPFLMAYILVLSLGYRSKEKWLKEYFALLLVANFIFLATPMPYFQNWTIYDPILSQNTSSLPVYFGPGKVAEIATFEELGVPQDISYERHEIGDLNLYYLSSGKGFDKESLKNIIGDSNAPIRTYNVTLGNQRHRMYVIFDSPIGNRSYVQSGTPLGGKYLYFINGTFHAYAQSHVAYVIGNSTNNNAVVLFIKDR